MCKTRKKFKVGSDFVFYICSCTDKNARLSWDPNDAIGSVNISDKAMRSYKEGHGLTGFKVDVEESKVNDKCKYHFTFDLQTKPSAETPLLSSLNQHRDRLEDGAEKKVSIKAPLYLKRLYYFTFDIQPKIPVIGISSHIGPLEDAPIGVGVNPPAFLRSQPWSHTLHFSSSEDANSSSDDALLMVRA